MPFGTAKAQIENSTQTEPNPLVDFLSQYSLSKIQMYSELGHNYTDKEVLFLSKKKYKGRPPRISSLLEYEMMSFEDKNLFLALLFDQCLDIVLPAIFELRSYNNQAITSAPLKAKSIFVDKQSEPSLLTVTEKFTVPHFQELDPSFKKYAFRGTYYLADMSSETRELIEKQLLRFKYNSGIKWPSSIYVTLLLYFVRKVIDQNVVQPCTNIDFINLLVFTSKIEVNVFTVFAFGFYVLTRLLGHFESEFFLFYCAFCLAQVRTANSSFWSSDMAITITFKTEYDFELAAQTASEASSEFINEFRKRFESQLHPFILLVLKANPGVSINHSLLQEFVASMNVKEFLLLIVKVFQIN